jgi:hypothetical protein
MQEVGNREQGIGLRIISRPVAMVKCNEEEMSLHIVRKTVGSVGVGVVREGSTGRVVTTMVPRIWAVADEARAKALPKDGDEFSGLKATANPGVEVNSRGEAKSKVIEDSKCGAASAPSELPEPEVAFYRKYTEALLRRYLRMSTEAGRVPSLMGRELFRGHVTSYKVKSFEDVVIFCHDVEKCLKVLDAQEGELIKRIALQAYSQAEAAAILGISLRWVVVKYAAALDKLTRELLEARILNPLEPCQ